MKRYSRQLEKIETALFAEIARCGYMSDENSYYLTFGNGYMTQRIECFDEDDEIVVVTQEIEMNDGKLIALGTHYQY